MTKGLKKQRISRHKTTPEIKSVPKAVPAISRARSFCLRPRARLKLAAPPIPRRREIATVMVVVGKATLVAAFPSIPTPCPMKIWSTMLYGELTSILMMLGMANFRSSCPIGALPSGFSGSAAVCFMVILLSVVNCLLSCLQKYFQPGKLIV